MEEEGDFIVKGKGDFIGMKGPKGTPYEGGVILLEIISPSKNGKEVEAIVRVVTPLHHPMVFTPIEGSALAKEA